MLTNFCRKFANDARQKNTEMCNGTFSNCLSSELSAGSQTRFIYQVTGSMALKYR